MTKDTVKVDGEEYIFPPNQVVKPEKQEQPKKHKENQEEKRGEEKQSETKQSKLQQRKQRINKEDKDKGKIIWTGGKIQ